MAGFKHLLIVKFKADCPVDDILNGMEKLVSEIDAVKSFECKEDYTAFVGHPSHVEFSATFSGAIDKIVLLDFPCVFAKASA
ncbi:ricin-agglutinin family protein [Hibiscus syriacus]|uniref:Ricin-agglutinin family protein n=1 Tax=Hibiscus syriacus TaxID=106335 RepID=A0A6A2XLE9_HIBSY|nr:ricin-agglutinin family protein [Hibiscus syriacus]